MKNKDLQKFIDKGDGFMGIGNGITLSRCLKNITGKQDSLTARLNPIYGIECSQSLIIEARTAAEVKKEIAAWLPKAFAAAGEQLAKMLENNRF